MINAYGTVIYNNISAVLLAENKKEKTDLKIPWKAKNKLILVMKISFYFHIVIFHTKRGFKECSYEFRF